MSRSSSVFNKILECPICLELFQIPKMLPCQHTFCLPCITKLYSCSGMTTGILRCPTCQTKHDLNPNQGGRKKVKMGPSPGDLAHILPNNFFVLSVMDLRQSPYTYSISQSASASPMLKQPAPVLTASSSDKTSLSCPECIGNPQWICTDCSIPLCISCLSNHLESPETKGHVVFNLEEDTKQYQYNPTDKAANSLSEPPSSQCQDEYEYAIRGTLEYRFRKPTSSAICPSQDTSDYAEVQVSPTVLSSYVDVQNRKISKRSIFGITRLKNPTLTLRKPINNSDCIRKLVTFDDTPTRVIVAEKVGIYVLFMSANSAIRKLTFTGTEELRFGTAYISVDMVAGRKTPLVYCLQGFDVGNGNGALRYGVQSYSTATGQRHEFMTIGYERQISLVLSDDDNTLITYDADRESLNFYDFHRKSSIRKIKLPALLISLKFSPEIGEVIDIIGDKNGKLLILFNQRPHIFHYPNNGESQTVSYANS